jgi:hypothetical protein
MTIERRLLLVATLTAACSPGELDPRLEQLREADAAPAPEPPEVTDTTPLAGCAKYPTLAEFEEKLMVPRCATAGCHTESGPFAPDLKTRPIHPRLVNALVVYKLTKCDKSRDRYIDTGAAPEKSYLVSKVRDANPTCPGGGPGGARMPFATKEPLPEEDITCFLSYVRALTGP